MRALLPCRCPDRGGPESPRLAHLQSFHCTNQHGLPVGSGDSLDEHVPVDQHVVLDDRSGRDLAVSLPHLAQGLLDPAILPLDFVLDVRLDDVRLEISILVQRMKDKILAADQRCARSWAWSSPRPTSSAKTHHSAA